MNVVYLLGAGASYHAIPVLRGSDQSMSLNNSIDAMFRHFRDRTGPFTDYQRENYSFIDNWLRMEGDKLIAQFFKFTTPDTLARKFFLNDGINSVELFNLKYALCIYFLLWQEAINSNKRITLGQILPSIYSHQPLDPRYFGFLTTLLNRTEKKIKLESNVKILSWNYDSQIEEVLAEIDLKESMQLYLKPAILEKFQIHAFDTASDLANANIIKLNGTYYDSYNSNEKNNTSLLDNLYEPSWFEQALRRLDIQMKQGMGNPPTLKFAWENTIPKFTSKLISYSNGFNSLKEIMIEAQKLVVIGYTFPHYNREMDRFILQAFSSEGGKTIHIQNTLEGIQANKERIHALCGFDLKNMRSHSALDEFFIPSEL